MSNNQGSTNAPVVIEPNWALSERVHVASSTRGGGLSAAPFDSLNLGLHVNDDERTVRANRKRLSEHLQLPSNPVWLNQVHGKRVVRCTDSQTNDDNAADASWTDRLNLVLAIMTADCLPVVIANERETAVAVAHAGWRGLADGVLSASCRMFAPGDTLHAWMGPAIGPTQFEVGEEVVQAFARLSAANQAAFTAGAEPGKYFADIYQLARNEFAAMERDVIVSGGDHCTVTETEQFFSYRRDGARSGRMATFAWIA